MTLLDRVAAHLQAHPGASALAVADALRVRRVAVVSVMMRMLRLRANRCMVEAPSTPLQTTNSTARRGGAVACSLVASHSETEAC